MSNLLAFTRRSVKNPPTIQDLPELGRSPEEGKGNPFQYSCLGNPMDRGAQSMGSQRVRLTKRITLSPRKYLSQMETKSPSSFVQISSVTQSCLTLYDHMDCSTPGFPVHHQLPELTQTHVHPVSDAVQPSHSLLSPPPPTFNLSQHQGLFQ